MQRIPISILVIEDDQFIRMFLHDMFLLHGHDFESKITTASTSTQAERYIEEMTPEIIFLDLGLPEVDEGQVDPNAGFRLLKKIRTSDKKIKDAPVIIFSGYNDPELKERAFKEGANEFLIKGEYLPKDIIAVVKKYCSTTTGTCNVS